MRLDYSGILQVWSNKQGKQWFEKIDIKIAEAPLYQSNHQVGLFYLIRNVILKFQIWVNYDTQIFPIKDMFEFVVIKSVVVSVADVFMFS